MAVNFQQVVEQVGVLARGAGIRQRRLEDQHQQAVRLQATWAGRGEELRQKVKAASRQDPALRCAIPLAGRLDQGWTAPPLPLPLTLIAADGSQIAPDRHATVLYSLINVGHIVLVAGSGLPPECGSDSQLLLEEQLYTPTGLLTPEAIEAQRDLAERRAILALALPDREGAVGLTDGPLELWNARERTGADYQKDLELHRSILLQLQQGGVIVAGYVDKPAADLVIRTLEIAVLEDQQVQEDIRRLHPLRGVSDRWLFARVLKEGQRSSVFAMQSLSSAHYAGDLALHFFYLNAGDERHAWIARVEIPAWVARDEQQLGRLHSALLEQCRTMGVRPYPYLLHRAHELAVVGFEEKQQVEYMLELGLRRAGAEVDQGSAKASAKALPGRSRHP
jgi:hypothetical protein